MGRNEGTDRMSEASCLSVAGVYSTPDELNIHHETEFVKQNERNSAMDDKKMDDEPLFKGGCGHSAKEIEDTAIGCEMSVLIGAGIIGISFLVSWIAHLFTA